MASNEIKILLGGDASGLVAASNAAADRMELLRKRLQSLQTFAAKTTDFSKLNQSLELIKKTQGELNVLTAKSSFLSGGGFQKIVPGANQAAAALTNVGRVAQDLPFGFIGIQNNLNPLLESFQRLKQETGSTGGALKALGGTLIGPAGIGLALSIVSSAFVIFQNGISGFNKKTKEAKDSADELAKSIKSIGSITGEATAGVQGQIAQVQALANVVSDSNQPYADRKRALEELQDINKTYFGDLRLEDSLTGKLAATVRQYTDALVNSAIQKTFVDEIAQVAKASVKATGDIQVARDALARARAAEAKEEANVARIRAANEGKGTGASGINVAISEALTRRAAATNKVLDAEQALRVVSETGTKLREQDLQLRDQLNNAVVEGLKFKDIDQKGSEKEVDALKRRIDALKKLQSEAGLTQPQQIELVQLEIQLARRDGIKLGFTPAEIEEQVDAILENAFPVKTFEFDVTARPNVKLDLPEVNIDIQKSLGLDKIPDGAFDGIINGIKKAGERAKVAAQQIVIDLGAIMEDFAVNAAVSLGESLGNIISGLGSAGDILKGFASLIGDVLIQLGKYVITAGVQMLALKKAFDNFIISNPQVAIVAGIAAVALGTALKNSFGRQKVPAFADGVINFGGGMALVGERGPELVNLPRGSDVIPNNALGGNIEVVVAGVMRGDDIYFTNQKVTRRKRRI